MLRIDTVSVESAPIQLSPVTSSIFHADIVLRVDLSDDVSNLVDVVRCHTDKRPEILFIRKYRLAKKVDFSVC